MTSTNEMGFAPILDGGVPRTVTVKAREDISGGQFVLISGAGADCVTSGVNSFAVTDLQACLVVDSTAGSGIEQINGIATDDIASGYYGTIATDCVAIVKCGSTVNEGTKVVAISNHSVMTVGSSVIPNATIAGEGGVPCHIPGAATIGRALSAGTSGTNKYAIVSFKF